MPVSDREQVYEVEVAAETTRAAPASTATRFNPGTVVQVQIVIPDGVAGLAGLQIRASGQQILPTNTGAWLTGNNEVITREIVGWPNSGRLEVTCYNEDVNAHKFVVRYSIVENGPAVQQPVATGSPATLSEPPPTQEQEQPPTPEPSTPLPSPPEPETPSSEPPSSEPEQPEGSTPLPEPPAEAEPEQPTPTIEPGAGGEAPPEFAAEPETTPEAEGAEPGKRRPPAKHAKNPKARYRTVKHQVKEKPKTGLSEAHTALVGHPEVHRGVATLVNLIRARWPQLQITSTTGGHHAPGSYHYKGEAVDLATGDTSYMHEAATWTHSHLERYLTEGIHNTGLSVKDGHAVDPSFWGATVWAEHANHIHVANAGAQEQELLRDNRPTVRTVTQRELVKPTGRKPAPHKPGQHKQRVGATGGTAPRRAGQRRQAAPGGHHQQAGHQTHAATGHQASHTSQGHQPERQTAQARQGHEAGQRRPAEPQHHQAAERHENRPAEKRRPAEQPHRQAERPREQPPPPPRQPPPPPPPPPPRREESHHPPPRRRR